MVKVQDIIDEAKVTYPDLGQSRAVALMNDLETEILLHIPLRKAVIDAPALVAGQQEYSLGIEVIKIWSAIYYQTTDAVSGVLQSGIPLTCTHPDTLDVTGSPWRFTVGTPTQFYTNQNSTAGFIGFTPIPDKSTLTVSGATNASPIQITTQTHGLTTGDTVVISGVTGNTAANGRFAITVTSPTAFTLDGSTGSGGYVSGGIILATDSPKVMLEITQKTELTAGTDLPSIPLLRSIYENGLRYYHARAKGKPDIATWKALFEDALANQVAATMQRAGRVQPGVQLVNQRPNWRRGGFTR